MKKFITMLLVGLMVFGSFGTVFAEEPNDTLMENILDDKQQAKEDKLEVKALKEEEKAQRLNLIKEFTEEIHQINALRIERNELQIQVIEKHDQLFNLYITVRESGDKEALEAAKEERQQIKEINAEIDALHEQAKTARDAFREALKNNDKEAANKNIESLIDIHTSINNKMLEKIKVLESIINILS
jgi:TolA-binding protein